MDRDEAIKIAGHWVAIRKEVRVALVAAAREANPVSAPQAEQFPGFVSFEWPSNAVRKLWQFPDDLSEERLLNLIELPHVEPDAIHHGGE